MSKQNHPNLNTISLAAAIAICIKENIRGNAQKAGMKVVFPLLSDDIAKFVEACSDTLDLLEAVKT